MSKRRRDWEKVKKDKKKVKLDRIESFWKKHYKIPDNDNTKLEASEVYQLFVQYYYLYIMLFVTRY